MGHSGGSWFGQSGDGQPGQAPFPSTRAPISGIEDSGIKNNTFGTYIDAYIIYGLISVLLASSLIVLLVAVAAHALKRKAGKAARTSSSNTGSTRTHSWMMLSHGDQETGPAATGSPDDNDIDCEAGLAQPETAEPPCVVAGSRRLGSRRPSLRSFLAATAKNAGDGGTTPKVTVVEKETTV